MDFDHDMSTLTIVGNCDKWEIGWPKMRKQGGGWEWVGYLKHVANLLKEAMYVQSQLLTMN